MNGCSQESSESWRLSSVGFLRSGNFTAFSPQCLRGFTLVYIHLQQKKSSGEQKCWFLFPSDLTLIFAPKITPPPKCATTAAQILLEHPKQTAEAADLELQLIFGYSSATDRRCDLLSLTVTADRLEDVVLKGSVFRGFLVFV